MGILAQYPGKKNKKKAYQQMIQELAPRPPVLKNAFFAFFFGGLICTVGQLLINFYQRQGLSFLDSTAATAATLVFVAAFLTGLGVWDTFGRIAGAGAIVPITGFANSMVAAALEYKREGMVFGVAARLFTIAGPVIVFGTVTAWLVGLLFYLVGGGK
ncbi:MAG: stage V sporulation protein AC [Bacillota bacterium]